MKNITVKVNKRHIRDGIVASYDSCPIALALKGDYCVFSSWIEDQDGDVVCDLPIKAQKFIARFDGKKSVKPFSFRLKIRE